MSAKLRAIPSVEKLLQALGPQALPRPLVVATVRSHLETLRTRDAVPDAEQILKELQERLRRITSSRLQPVINGTGIIVHTNLGRSPLAADVGRTISELAGRYMNLEIDLESGERGSRAAYLDSLLALLCESEGATVVNNCAAALVLILRHFTRQKPEVIISRGELVQIGGGFRIPEILESSGAKLKEVGTTNQTTLADYQHALSDQTGLILKVHQSNFRMSGFVGSPAGPELSGLAHENGVPYAQDLGSGAVIETQTVAGLPHEPTPAEILREGTDLVCFSGDKLLGGPQAGIIAGHAGLVKALKGNPLFRALRCDKLILAALQTTVEACFAAPEAPLLPTVQMLKIPIEQLRARAEAMLHSLSGTAWEVTLCNTTAHAGGGTLPEAQIDSIALEILPRGMSVAELARRLRIGSPPLIGYLAEGRLRIDLRTVFAEQDETVVQTLKHLLSGC